MNAWSKKRVDSLCEITSSKRIFASDYVSEGVPFYRAKEISEKHRGNVNVSTELFIRRSQFERIRTKFGAPQAGDLLLTSIGALLGSPYVVKDGEEFYFKDGNLTWFRNLHGIESQFLYYWMLSPQGNAELQKAKIGSAQPAFTINLLKQMEVHLPPLPVQQRISRILLTYDDLIENNSRRIKILEEMAQMIYREWFVKFLFPGHKKAEMVESEMGSVPKGWQVQKVTEAVDVDPTTRVPKEGIKPFVPMGSLSHASMLISDLEQREGNGGSKFRNGDTLFARITPCLENGKTGFVQFLPNSEAVAFGSTEFIVLRSRTLSPEYVYLMARSEEFRDNAVKSMSGATGRQRVQEACFDKFFIAHPPRQLLQWFQAAVAPLFRLIYVLNLKNENLCQSRSLLLPKLISGEISVDNAQKEAAAQGA